MSRETRWLWEIYLFVYLGIVCADAYNFFAAHTPKHIYLQILHSFHPVLWTTYILNLLQTAFSVLHILPLALYIFQIPLFQPRLWRYLLIIRLAFDLTGHSYEMNTILSMRHADPMAGSLGLLFVILPYLPSYLGCYRYAFRRENWLKA